MIDGHDTGILHPCKDNRGYPIPGNPPPWCPPRDCATLGRDRREAAIDETADNLLFHALVDDEDRAPVGWCSVQRFRHVLEEMLENGRRPRRLADYLGPAPPGPGEFTVSFDDAHPSVRVQAAPVLRDLGIPATLFVPTAYVGETDLVMSWAELAELASDPGWVLGSHDAVHRRASWRLYAEDRDEQLARLTRDARRARREMERRLGAPPDLHAYPFGEAPEAARRAVAAAGYRAACTVAQDAGWDGDLLRIPRREPVVTPGGGEPPAISLVVPACDRPELLAEGTRRLCAQTYPPERFEVLVVDDGSSVDLGRALPDGVRLVRLEGADRTFRAGQARQAGARAARFDLLCFLDADVAVDRDFLWHLGWCHRQVPDAVVLGYLSGYNLHDHGHRHLLDAIRPAERLTGDRVPVVPDRSREPELAACLDSIQAHPRPWTLCYTGNLSLPRALLERAGGFSGTFSGWGLEDIDLGVRLYRAGARWVFSRFALGYHLTTPGELQAPPSNPFRHPQPDREVFTGLLSNLEVLEERHRSDPEVTDWCRGLRADIDEHLAPPEVVGVECGAPEAFDWPFRRHHRRHPGGVEPEAILDRFAHAHKLGVREVYLLGGDVLLRRDLPGLLEAARRMGITRITAETTATGLDAGRAAALAGAGLTGAVIEVLAGDGHPADGHRTAAAAGVGALRQAGIRLGAKLVLGANDRDDFNRARAFVDELELALYTVVVLAAGAQAWVGDRLDDDVTLVVE